MLKLIVVVQAFVATASIAVARQIESWPYDRLLANSDVVVIASVQAVAPSERRPAESLMVLGARGRITTFHVKLVIKGEVGRAISVLHYQLPEGVPTVGGPMLARFRTREVVVTPANQGLSDRSRVVIGVPDYLLCLKKTADDHFEPVSGQYDSALSAREIYTQMPNAIDDSKDVAGPTTRSVR